MRLLCLIPLLLAACAEGANTAGSSSGEARVDARQIERGGRLLVNLEQASENLKKFCLATRPGFETLNEKLAAAKFDQNPRTGTYFNPTLDLSVQLTAHSGKPACSMVFVSEEDETQLGFLLAMTSFAGSEDDRTKVTIGIDEENGAYQTEIGAGQIFEFRPRAVRNGKRYFRTFVFTPDSAEI